MRGLDKNGSEHTGSWTNVQSKIRGLYGQMRTDGVYRREGTNGVYIREGKEREGKDTRTIGRSGHKLGRGPNMGHFCPSCVRLVYFLRKPTEFHVKQTECQIILLHFLLLIFS